MRKQKCTTKALASDEISIDFVREGTGHLIFRRNYPLKLLERASREGCLTEGEWAAGTLSKALSLMGWEGTSAITLHFASNGKVLLQIQIPALAWEAFEVLSERRKVDPASYLAVLVGEAIASGITAAKIVKWLGP